MRLDIQYAQEVLSEAAARQRSPQAREQYAVEQRLKMRQDIMSGAVDRSSYRFRWLLDSAKRLQATLRERGQEFDSQHPMDVSTLLDQLDVVNTVRVSLLKRLDQLGIQVEDPAETQDPDECPESCEDCSHVEECLAEQVSDIQECEDEDGNDDE